VAKRVQQVTFLAFHSAGFPAAPFVIVTQEM
jgi:hypothetical protein